MSIQPTNIEESGSYKSIFKATTLFGGVQVYQIIIGIIRSKFVAVLLGAAGLGIQGLYQSTIQFIQSITALGLSQSAVRDVSEANGSGDAERIGKTVYALRRLVWITGLIGTVLVIALSPLLSKVTFGNYDYTIPFILLSCILLLDQLASGQRVVLQGLRKLKELARASAVGVTVGLFFSIPLYYAFGIKGIVPTLILNSLSSLIIFWFFSRKIKLPAQRQTVKETLGLGKSMIRMGVAMSISGILTTAFAYIIRAFIMREGGAQSVGLFQAGFVIINTYVGMVFSAIGTDFYPRLAAVNDNNAECRKVISQQGEIATEILAPLLCICIVLMPVVLRVLYSDKFYDAGPFVLWCCPGMMFRLASWLIAYQFVAKAESRLFIIAEIVGGSIYTVFSLLGYHLGGLTGLGIAFTADYLVYLIIVYIIAYRRYGFSFNAGFTHSYILQFALVITSLVLIVSLPSPLKYWAGAVPMCISCIYALYVLEDKTQIVSQFKITVSERLKHR